MPAFPFLPLCRAAVVALLVAAVAPPSWAADPLPLLEALRIAAARSQQLLAMDALGAAAREQAVAAGQLPDPVLKLGVDNLPVSGPDRFSLASDFMTMRRIGVVQELVRADKRQLKAQKFEREAQRLQALRLAVLANVQRDTALAWLDAYYNQAMRVLLQQQMAQTQLQVQGADIAYRTGKGSQADVFAARAAVLGLEDRLSQIDAQGHKANLMLTRWLGSDAQRTPVGAPSWQSTPGLGGISTEHLQSHPDLQALRAEVDAAQTEAQLAQANTRADWSVEASYAQRGPGYANMLSVGVSIPLQLDSKHRQDREVAAKLALVNEAKARYEDMLRSHEAEVRGFANDWQTGKERLARYQDGLIPTTHQRVEAALAAYRTGKGDLASVLGARRDEIEARMQALAIEMEAARAWAQLNFLQPEHTAGTPPAKDSP